ncbi:protein Hikeshi-like [Lytechinus variegatus]|uniref:protein Hikeshi-like n=1 Tax=Lytechinus variegatus TaxID=7654 RepID=UPI001BB2CE47|nr:protein Hikeshi-like [Lytechinus variegatus]
MFACLVAGRLVQGEPQQVDPTHFIFNIDNAASINHVIVFLTGAAAFPEGTGAAVHFGQPSPTGMTWHNLGYISNEKPSVIFKISGLKNMQSTPNSFFTQAQQANALLPSTSAHIGIAVEPLAELKQQTPAANTQASNVESFVQFTQKMLENFYNYASSFAITQDQMTPQPGVQYLPADVLTKWYENFQRRLTQDPNFWKK